MPEYRRANAPGSSYFFTVNTLRRQNILTDVDVRVALREGIEIARQLHPFQIDAWVLLPDHIHAVWTLPEGDADFSVRWGIIKRQVSKRCGARLRRDEWLTDSRRKRQETSVWQRRFWEHLIRDEEDYRRHVDYIHWNPAKHGYVKKVEDWPYSTFHRYVARGVYSTDWCGSMNSDECEMDFGEAGGRCVG